MILLRYLQVGTRPEKGGGKDRQQQRDAQDPCGRGVGGRNGRGVAGRRAGPDRLPNGGDRDAGSDRCKCMLACAALLRGHMQRIDGRRYWTRAATFSLVGHGRGKPARAP